MLSSVRAELLARHGLSSLPHVFVGGKSVGGLYSGSGEGDSVGLVAQSYLPGMPQRLQAPLRPRLLRFGAYCGVATVSICLSVVACARVFTADAAVVSAIRLVAPLLCWAGLTYSVASASEGMVIAQSDTVFVAQLYAVIPFITLGALLLFRRLLGPGLSAAWSAMLVFHLTRLLTLTGRLVRRGDLKLW